MDFFIQDAWAQAQSATDPFGFLLPMLVIFGAFYFLLIRPQQKRQKSHTEMVSALAKGDEVITAGGILGRVSGVSDQFVSLTIANGVEIKVQKQTVSSVVPKGTVDAA